MSISSEINRISQNVSDSLAAVASKGATVPSGANSDNLPSLIASLPSTKSVTYNLTGGASASVTPSKAVDGQGFSVKLKAPAGYALSGVTITMGGVNITSQVFTPDVSGGGGSAELGTKTITVNGTYDAEDDDLDGYSSVTVNVANSYSAGDEGKVVSNGALVAQGSDTTTTNGTVDTTLISSLLVNVASPVKTKTGTFVGSGARTQTIACDFEPDVIWIYGTTDQASIRATETFILIRDTAQYLRYYSSTSNTTSFAYTLRNNITGLDSDSTMSYSMQTTYANGNVSIYAYTSQSRYYFNSAITYSYKFIKYTS